MNKGTTVISMQLNCPIIHYLFFVLMMSKQNVGKMTKHVQSLRCSLETGATMT